MRRTVVESLVVAALAVVAMVLLLRLWEADLGVPFSDSGDAKFYAGVTKSLDEGAWYLENPKLGAPFGSQLYDVPLGGENLQMAALKALTLVAGWATAYNLYFLLGFPLTAAVAFVVARRSTGLPTPVAGTVALLYAFLPYHLARGEMHPLLANYAVVPLAGALVLAVARGSDLTTGRRGWPAIGVAVLLGTTSTYYAIFTGLLLVAMGVLAGIARREWRPPLTGAAAAAVIAAALAVNLAPSLLYWANHGGNATVERTPQESEVFGLKISQLVLPVDDHRIGAFADLSERARCNTIAPSEAGAGLGALGAIGLVIAIVAGLTRGLRRSEAEDEAGLGTLGVALIVSLLVALIGGLGFIFSLGGFRVIRGWNRMSIFIGFFALLALGHVLVRLIDTARRRGTRRQVTAGGLALLLVVGLADETPTHPISYDEVARRFGADGRFVGAIEESVGPEASIFQLPMSRYPEAGLRVSMDDYDHLRGYLHADALRWSYGATFGREGRWLRELDRLPPLTTLVAAAAAGFDGLWVDRAGYTDRGGALESTIRPFLGDIHQEGDGRRWFADLRGFRREMARVLGEDTLDRVRDATLHPLEIEWGNGFSDEESLDGVTSVWGGTEAELTVVNPGNDPRPATLRFSIASAPSPVTVTWNDGSQTIPARPSAEARSVSISFDAPPGRSTIRFATSPPTAGDGRADAFELRDPDVIDAVLLDATAEVTAEARRTPTRESASSPTGAPSPSSGRPSRSCPSSSTAGKP